MKLFRLFFASAAVTIACHAFGQTSILSWDVTGTNSNTSLAATSIAANLDIGGGFNALTRNGVVYASATSAFNSSGWTIASSLDMSTANNISFTLSPATGYQLTLNSIQFAVSGSNTAPKNGVWAYRTDSGSYTQLGTYTVPSTTSALTTLSFGTPPTIAANQSITLAFFAYGSGSGASVNNGTPAAGGTIRIRDITGSDLIVNGSVTAIPEPSTYAAIFGALALAGVVVHRRRQARR